DEAPGLAVEVLERSLRGHPDVGRGGPADGACAPERHRHNDLRPGGAVVVPDARPDRVEVGGAASPEGAERKGCGRRKRELGAVPAVDAARLADGPDRAAL